MAFDFVQKVRDAVAELDDAVESGHFGNVRVASVKVSAAVDAAENAPAEKPETPTTPGTPPKV
jgi:hypothetical protein